MAFGVTRDPLSGAVRANAAATGSKLYGAGRSTAATTGPVEKAGYEEREMRKRARKRIESRKFAVAAGGSTPLGGAGLGASTYSGR
jgi:hypothetical protein